MSIRQTFVRTVENPIGIVVNNEATSPDDSSTTSSMDIGDSFTGTLDFVLDWDWIAIDLEEGQTIQVDMDGGTLADPVISIFDENDLLIAQNDQRDGFLINDSTLFYHAYEDETVYIVADSYLGQGLGSYTVSVSLAPTPPAFDVLDTITWGTQLSSTSVDVFIAPSGFTADGITAEGFNAYERQQIELAFQMIDDVSGLTFNYVTSSASADLILIGDSNQIGVGPDASLGFFYPPEFGPNAGLGVFATNLWDSFAGGDLELGGNGHATIVHEILHGLGLAHPHDDGAGDSTIMPWAIEPFYMLGAYDLSQGVFTTMSYNVGAPAGIVGAQAEGQGNVFATPELDWGVQAGPMALDIAVLQELYGANTTHASGNDVYTIPSANFSGTAWMAIWDTGGIDEIRYSFANDAVIDLRAATLEDEFGGGGFLSGADNIAGGFTIAHGVVIENATSGIGDDLIYGNDANNTINTSSGDDIVYSGRGDDRVNLGNGDDQLWGGSGNDTIFGGAGEDFLRGSVDQDVLYGGENNDSLRGQKHNDTLYGENGNDNLNAGGGNDVLYGGNGDDFVRGGTRRDEMYGGNDNDNMFGNSFDDVMYGGSGNDLLNGGGQNDRLDGGIGNDTLKGGADIDTFAFNVGYGSDVVTDFNVAEDFLQISTALASGATSQDIVDSAVTSGGNTVITLGTTTITLNGVNSNDLLATSILIDDALF